MNQAQEAAYKQANPPSRKATIMGKIIEIFFKERRYQFYFIGAVILVIYAKTVLFNFTYMDDNVLVLVNKFFLKDLRNILEAFRSDAFGREIGHYYRPLLTVSFILDAQLSGISPVIYHLTNIILHIVSTCLLLVFFNKLGYSNEKSLFFSLIFAVHPVLAQAVAWIPGRNDTLLAVFSFTSFIFLIRYCGQRNIMDYLTHMIFLMLALFTKETAVLLAPVFAVYMWLLLKERVYSSKNITLIYGWAIALGVWLAARMIFIKSLYDIPAQYKLKFTVEGIPALVQYTGKILFPFNLSALPMIRDTTYMYGATAIVLLSAALVLSPRKRMNNIVFGVFWFVIFLLPTFCMPNSHELEHRLYMPMAGFFMVLEEVNLGLSKIFYYIFGITVILLFAAITFIHSDIFKDRRAYWENAVKYSPHSSLAHQGAGLNYLCDGKLEQSEKELKESIRLDDYNSRASHIILGMIYWSENMFNDSENEFKLAIKMDPWLDMGYADYAGFCYSRKRMEEAEFYWKKAIELNANNVDVYKKLATLCYNSGRREEAARYSGLLKEKWNIDYVPEDNRRDFNAKGEIDAGK